MHTVPSILRSAALGLLVGSGLGTIACSSNSGGGGSGGSTARNPDTTAIVPVDRFSDAAAHLFKRSTNSSFPGPNQPIHCDQGPFITEGLGPGGEKVTYYNFDVQPTAPAPIYVLFAEGSSTPVAGQLNVIDVLPGDPGYSDFWRVTKVSVPAGYVANSVTSLDEIHSHGYPLTATSMLVNCPVVPDGSTAMLRYTSESAALSRGWYRDQVVKYFSFDEHMLTTDAQSMVPVVPILVAFNINPSPTNPKSGPPSGFETETGSMQTHNVIAALPTDPSYSPLWLVSAYDDAAFASVTDLATASKATVVAPDLGNVNCPVVAKH
jgi:hypothetical protein